MKDGDNYIIALLLTALLPAVAAFNKKLLDLALVMTIVMTIVSCCFLFFPGTIKDWNLIPSTIRAGSHSIFLNYLNYNFKVFRNIFLFSIFVLIYLFSMQKR